MLIDFNEMKEMTIPDMNSGTGTMTAKMFMHDKGQDHTDEDPSGRFDWNT